MYSLFQLPFIYNPLLEWGYEHKTVCHGAGEYAWWWWGDRFCESMSNTVERSLFMRSWLRPHHWHFLQEKLPLCLPSSLFTIPKALLECFVGLLSLPRNTYWAISKWSAKRNEQTFIKIFYPVISRWGFNFPGIDLPPDLVINLTWPSIPMLTITCCRCQVWLLKK